MADSKPAGQDEPTDEEGLEIIKQAGYDAWEKHQAAKGGTGK